MTKNRTVMPLLLLLLLLLSGFFPPHVADATEEGPPSSSAIYQTLEQLWVDGKFAELEAHVHELERLWEGYVPVELTLAAYSSRYGSQVEDAIDRLTMLRDRLSADITVASPIFMGALDSQIVRHHKTLEFYLQRGMSRDQRLASINPITKTKFTASSHWAYAMTDMYFNAPEVFATDKGIVPARPKETTDTVPDLKQMDAQQLLQLLRDDEITMSACRAAAKELAGRRAAAGGAREVSRGFNEAATGYMYRDTVEELVRMGRDAVPSVLEVLDVPHTDKNLAIWALVRIGAADPEVIQALQKVAKSGRADDAKYARDALRYLQTKHQGTSTIP